MARGFCNICEPKFSLLQSVIASVDEGFVKRSYSNKAIERISDLMCRDPAVAYIAPIPWTVRGHEPPKATISAIEGDDYVNSSL